MIILPGVLEQQVVGGSPTQLDWGAKPSDFGDTSNIKTRQIITGWMSSAVFPAGGGYLTSIFVWIKKGFSNSDTKVGIAQGGVSATDPSGATILYELDPAHREEGSGAWIEFPIDPAIELTGGQRTWIIVGGDGAVEHRSATTDAAFAFNNLEFHLLKNEGLSANVTSWPSTVPATGTSEVAAEVLAAYLQYSL